MGDAKRRGSFESRVKESNERQNERRQVSVSQVIADLGLPAESQFLGYVIHNPDSDDYLLRIKDTPAVTERFYCATPESAVRFDDYAQAEDVAAKIKKKTLIGLLFDTGTQFVVGFNG